MFLAEPLSRAFLPEVNTCDLTKELEEVDHRASLPVSQERWRQIRQASANDPVFQQLRATTIHRGWPRTKSEIPECLYSYFDVRHVLTVQNELVFNGKLLVVPAALRKELMAVVHSSHIGIEGCKRRARDTLYWHRMATSLREYISKCDVCLAHTSPTCNTCLYLVLHEIVSKFLLAPLANVFICILLAEQ